MLIKSLIQTKLKKILRHDHLSQNHWLPPCGGYNFRRLRTDWYFFRRCRVNHVRHQSPEEPLFCIELALNHLNAFFSKAYSWDLGSDWLSQHSVLNFYNTSTLCCKTHVQQNFRIATINTVSWLKILPVPTVYNRRYKWSEIQLSVRMVTLYQLIQSNLLSFLVLNFLTCLWKGISIHSNLVIMNYNSFFVYLKGSSQV